MNFWFEIEIIEVMMELGRKKIGEGWRPLDCRGISVLAMSALGS
jgi:hypothetical protein